VARFDVYAGSGPGYLLDCQADQLSHFRTRFVVPLLPADGVPVSSRLHPIFMIDGVGYVMVTQLASAIATRDLGRKVTDLVDQHTTIMNALDMLTTGY
jgi:toxin CcdB